MSKRFTVIAPFALLAPALVLSGCGGVSRTAAERCASAGSAPGTPAHARCVETTEAQDAANSRKVLNSVPIRGYGPSF